MRAPKFETEGAAGEHPERRLWDKYQAPFSCCRSTGVNRAVFEALWPFLRLSRVTCLGSESRANGRDGQIGIFKLLQTLGLRQSVR